MAQSEPIKSEQVVEPDVLGPVKKEFTELNSLMNQSVEILKEFATTAANIAKTTPLDSFDNIEKVEKSIRDVSKATTELDKIEKDRIKLQEKLKELQDDRQKANFEIREQIRLETKALRDNAKETVNSKNAYEQLIDRKKKAEKELLRLTTTFGKNSDEVKEARQEYENIKDEIEEVNSVLKEDEAAFQALNDELKEAKKNAQDVAAEFGVASDEAKEAAAAFTTIKNQVDEINQSLKEVDSDAYKRLTADTNEAQAEFKRLAAELGESSDEAQEALRRFEKLDDELQKINKSARDGRRNVGRYEEGVAKLNKTLNRFASATIVLKVLELLQSAVSQNSESAAEFEKVWIRVTTVFTVTVRRLVEAFPILQARIENFFLGTQILFFEFREELSRIRREVSEFFGQGTDDIPKFSDKIDELRKRQQELAKVASQDLAPAFAGMRQEIDELINQQDKLIDDTLRYRRQIVELENEISSLIALEEKLRAEFDSDTTSLEEQIRAGVAFREELMKRFALEEQIASRRLVLAQQNAKVNKQNVDAQEELSAATREYTQLVAEQAAQIIETENKIQKLRDDATQLNLDFYVDDAQNRIVNNQRIIDDETQTFERRRELLQENLRETEEANRLRAEALNKSLRERNQAEIDFEELRKLRSSEEIVRTIRESGISEQLAIRALEIIRERRTELQDLAEAERDLAAAEAESQLMQSDVLLQRRALIRLQREGADLEQVLSELSAARLQNEIDSLRERLQVAEEGSAQFIALNQELNDKLLQQNQERAAKEKQMLEERKKELQKFGKDVNAIFSVLSNLADERTQKRLSNIDRELQAEQERANQLQEIAERGNEDAERNLAITEQRQRELELQRQQQLERQQRNELITAALQTYGSKVQAGDANPLASTIADVEVLRAFINSLPSFLEGSEGLEKTDKPLDNQGGRLIIAHEGEKIFKPAHSKLIGQMSNQEVAMLAYRERTKTEKREHSNILLLRELQDLKKVTKERPVYLGSDYNAIEEAILAKIKKAGVLERHHKKIGGVFGKHK